MKSFQIFINNSIQSTHNFVFNEIDNYKLNSWLADFLSSTYFKVMLTEIGKTCTRCSAFYIFIRSRDYNEEEYKYITSKRIA